MQARVLQLPDTQDKEIDMEPPPSKKPCFEDLKQMEFGPPYDKTSKSVPDPFPFEVEVHDAKDYEPIHGNNRSWYLLY